MLLSVGGGGVGVVLVVGISDTRAMVGTTAGILAQIKDDIAVFY